jgi:16S rRNA (guanine(966)-N(2))-methyltransferase RsmD
MPEGGRVIGGSCRGTRLQAPRGGPTRPLSDRVKEALFGALEADGSLVGPFLDLFAGTGAAGIEALSRGAERATFVEHDGGNCALIGANLRRTGLANGHVVRADALTFLRNGLPAGGAPYRATLLDPPYGDPILVRAIELLADASRGWLARDAVVVAKHFWRDQPPAAVGMLHTVRQRRFGETALTFYTPAEEAV